MAKRSNNESNWRSSRFPSRMLYRIVLLMLATANIFAYSDEQKVEEKQEIVVTDGELRLAEIKAIVQPLYTFSSPEIDIGQVRIDMLAKEFETKSEFTGFTQPLDDWKNAERHTHESVAYVVKHDKLLKVDED